jgi:hypothetical protein
MNSPNGDLYLGEWKDGREWNRIEYYNNRKIKG